MPKLDLARELAYRATTERTDSDNVSATITISYDERPNLDTVYETVVGYGQYAPEAFEDLADKLRRLAA